MNGLWILVVVFYPVAAIVSLGFPWLATFNLRTFSALASAFIVALVLWLDVLPRDLSWAFGSIDIEPRFALPLTAYLAGLPIAAILTIWAVEKKAA